MIARRAARVLVVRQPIERRLTLRRSRQLEPEMGQQNVPVQDPFVDRRRERARKVANEGNAYGVADDAAHERRRGRQGRCGSRARSERKTDRA